MITPLSYARADYHIVQYTEQIYKIIRFNVSVGNLDGLYYGRNTENVAKLDAAFSRARSTILALALCNHWDWFFTGTIDAAKFDRFDLNVFYKAFSQWLRDQRKKFPACAFRFLLVPERHKDGAWHLHGFLAGVPADRLRLFDPSRHPLSLCNGVYRYWMDYNDKFGFCSLSPVRDPVAAAFYVTKYISEDIATRSAEVGKHLYFCSRGLERCKMAAEVFGHRADLDRYLEHDYQFCSVGMTRVADALDWTFPLAYGDAVPLFGETVPEEAAEPCADVCEDVDDFVRATNAYYQETYL